MPRRPWSTKIDFNLKKKTRESLVQQWPDGPKDGGIHTFPHEAPGDLLEARKKLMEQAIELLELN